MKEIPQGQEELSEIGKILRGEIHQVVTHGESFSEKEASALVEKRKEKGIDEESLQITNPEGKEPVKIKPDLDGRAAVFLLEEAGIKYNKLTFVKKGDWIPGSINIDTGERPNFAIEKDGSVFFDHHGSERMEKDKTTSATSLVYDTLIQEGLLEKNEWLDNLVSFVTDIDNADYPLDSKFFLSGWAQSWYGLHKMVPFEVMVEYFRKGATAEKPFTDEEIKTGTIKTMNGTVVPIKDLCERQQKFVEGNVKEVKDAERMMLKRGIKNFEEGELKKVVINQPAIIKEKVVNKIPLGFTATRALGFDSYIMWNGDRGGFFMTSIHTLDSVYEKLVKEFPDAKLIRGTMIIQNPTGNKIDQEKFLRTLNLLRKG